MRTSLPSQSPRHVRGFAGAAAFIFVSSGTMVVPGTFFGVNTARAWGSRWLRHRPVHACPRPQSPVRQGVRV